jgi:hypothetical protein
MKWSLEKEKEYDWNTKKLRMRVSSRIKRVAANLEKQNQYIMLDESLLSTADVFLQ